MLLLPLFWLWIALVGYSLGHALLGRRLAAELAPELVVATGLAGLSWGLSLLSFGTPIGPGVQLSVSGIVVLYGVWRWWQAAPQGRRQWAGRLLAPVRRPGQWTVAALLLVFGALTLVHAAQPPAFPDSALYHAQTVQWLQRYPVVPGLGNLHGRLAFNSHLHLLTAFFSASPQPRSPAWQQALSSFWFGLLLSYAARQTARTWWLTAPGTRASQVSLASGAPGGLPPSLALYYLGVVALVFVAYRPWISSPMPDSSVALLTLLLLGWVLEKLAAPAGAGPLRPAETRMLAGLLATAITFKLSAGYLALPLGYAAWQLRPVHADGPSYRRAERWLGPAALVGTLVLLPWLGRNIVLSGYAVYPSAPWAGLPVDWQVPPAQLAEELREIRDFARWPAGGWKAVATMRPGAWLPFWWGQQFPGDQRLLLAVGTLAAGLGLTRLRRGRPAQAAGIETLFFLLLACCAAWFVAAPAFRFGYGYLIGAALLGGWLVVRRLPGGLVRTLTLALVLGYGLNGLRREISHLDSATLIWPADYPPRATAIVLVQGRPVRVAGPATSGRCGNSPLPCVEVPPPTDLQWRGAGPAQGFRRGASASGRPQQ